MTGPRPDERANWNIVSITAHRDLTRGDVGLIIQTIADIVRDPTVDAIYFGGAAGGDTYALRTALRLRRDKRPWLVVVVPSTVSRQPIATQQWTMQADEVLEMHLPLTSDDGFKAYTIRDQYLVDVATSLTAFFSGDYKTGTGKTVRMAEKVGLQIQWVRVVGKPKAVKKPV